jgi:hypothetical protein
MRQRVWSFITSVCRHWSSLVTGGIFIALLSIYQGTGHTVSSWFFTVIGVVALLFACFRAWDEQYERAEAETARNAKPELVGEILHARISTYGMIREKGGPDIPHAMLLMKVAVAGRNEIETTIKGVSLVFQLDGMSYTSTYEEITGSLFVIYRDQYGTHQERPVSLVQSITSDSPIRYRVRSKGWVLFHIAGLRQPEPKSPLKADLTLTVYDELDEPHKIVAMSQRIET